MEYVLGIDVSRFQGTNLDFIKISNAGIDFIICKCTHGISSVDSSFKKNWNESKGKIKRGAYMWFVPEQDPIAQADFFISTMGDLNDDDLPPSIDFEQKTTIVGKLLLDKLLICVNRVREKTGRKPLLYTGKWYWEETVKVDCIELIELVDLWHAEYPSTKREGVDYADALMALKSPHPAKPWQDRNISPILWQFDGDGGLRLPNGVDSDFDRFEGTIKDFESWIKSSHLKNQIKEEEPIQITNPPEILVPVPEVIIVPTNVVSPTVVVSNKTIFDIIFKFLQTLFGLFNKK